MSCETNIARAEKNFSELQFAAACGAFILLSEVGTIVWLGRVCVLSIKPCSSFPRRAAPSVHIRLHMVQHVSQSVFDHSAPAHVTHLRRREENNHRGLIIQLSVRCVTWARTWFFTDALTGWYLRSFGGYLKCGPKLTDTWKETKRVKLSKQKRIKKA